MAAEILLQRTTATAVTVAYVSFVTQYPSPETVVAATSDDLKQRIAPLGLTKRAAFIEQCSHQLLAQHGGTVPYQYTALLALHGVGEYTARSVLIHAFNGGVAAVDTNVRRLISRFFGIDTDSDAVASLADALTLSAQSSEFQYAMLDFAADVCTVQSPRCDTCLDRETCDSSAVSTGS